MPDIDLSVVVISYNMARELPRTVRSLSPQMQRGIDARDYEIIVVDNGSPIPPRLEDYLPLASNLRIIQCSEPTASPVRAINEGLMAARGRLVGVMIDGARMASPGLLAMARDAAAGQDRPVVGTIAFHLGPTVQSVSILNGYCQDIEDDLLEKANWEADGYRLFDISALAGSSADGWLVIPAESNAVFLTAEHWREMGGYDEAFRGPGGGLANLDVWARLCEENDVTILLGETTFHQVHGGVATNSTVDRWPQFHEEYVAIRGKAYARPKGIPRLYGRVHKRTLTSFGRSLERFANIEMENG